jgi:serine/threonine protein kinase/tetratricopeptide (TPR) repeat protein
METPDVAEVQRAVGERYEVLELAGAGGMGAVYRARHCALGHFVAIKTLPPEVMESGMRQERFKREAGLAAHLSHPNIVPVFEFEQRAGVAYLIMPFVRGHSLGSMLGDGTRLALVDLMRVLVDIGAALDFVHPRGVIHRDVKPANIMIEDDTGRALLTDFGVAYVSPTTSGALTAVGSAIGTPDYMAPEQAIGRRIDGRADLYALAIVAYESLTGTLPMLSESPDAPARALHEARPEIAPRVAAALMAPLAQQPADRPASAAQWLAQIKRASSGARRQALLLGAVVVAALLVVGKIALGRHEAAVAPATVAVMPFTVSGSPSYSTDRLPEAFLYRFGSVPQLRDAISFGRVLDLNGGSRSVTPSDADTIARKLGAKYFVNAAIAFQGGNVTLTATFYETGRPEPLATPVARVSVDSSLDNLWDAAWAQILAVVGAEFRRNPYATMPHGKDAVAAYLKADDAFLHANYTRAQVLYDSVTRLDQDFAPAYLRRVLVLAQVAPVEDSLRIAMLDARRHRAELAPSDSLLLEGYIQLVEHGDGIAALKQFREAVDSAPKSYWARFALGEFYYYFGQLFDIEHPLDSARAAFDSVLVMKHDFAAAIANSISLAHLQNRDPAARNLIAAYYRVDSTSLVAEVIGLADTFLFHTKDALKVVNTLERHDFTVLEFLAFQAAQAGTLDQRRGPARRILRELARKARTPPERNLALRFGLAADLREGWTDSARARLASSDAEATERDEWLILAAAAGVPSLGDGAAARQRAAERTNADTSATLMWLLGATAPGDPARYRHVLQGQARDGSPLPSSLLLDLEARRLLAAGDTMGALQKWDEAMRRYAVLAAPFGLVASLWPLRRDLVRIAALRKDSTRVDRGCRSFDALVGFVDQIVKPAVDSVCDAWRRQRR